MRTPVSRDCPMPNFSIKKVASFLPHFCERRNFANFDPELDFQKFSVSQLPGELESSFSRQNVQLDEAKLTSRFVQSLKIVYPFKNFGFVRTPFEKPQFCLQKPMPKQKLRFLFFGP